MLLFAVQVWTLFFGMQQTVWNHRLIQFNAVLAWKKEGNKFDLKRETSNDDQL